MGCSPRSIATPRRARAGAPSPGGSWASGLMVPPPRGATSVLRGEADDMLARACDATSRGLRVVVFDAAGHVKHEDTYDTWRSITESQRLAVTLSGLSGFEFVSVTSFDAWERCFSHHAANEFSKLGIDGRRLLKQSEAAKVSWDALAKRLGGEPPEDSRPDGHGHPLAAIGIKGRKPIGRTVLHEDLTLYGPVAEIAVTLEEITEMRATVEGRESLSEAAGGRAVGVCKVVTPFRWSHEAGDGPYNTLPGHSFTSPSKEDKDGKGPRVPPEDRSLNAVIFG